MAPSKVTCIVFEKEVIFHSNIIMHLKVHELCATMMLFLSLFSVNFDDQLSQNVRRFAILCV